MVDVVAPRARRRRRTLEALLLGLILSTSVACGSEPPGTVAAETTTATTTTPPPPPPPPPVYWPLTGIESGQVAPRPALAVKIENSKSSRPQTGLNSADLVWEQVVEGGITRYVAVFHSTLPPEIGPIRSVRPMDPAIAAPLRGLFAFSGGQGPFVDAVEAVGLQVVSHDRGHDGFYRHPNRRAPHDVYADPAVFLAQADPAHSAAPAPQFTFPPAGHLPTAMVAGTPAGVLDIKLSGVSRPRWTYDPGARAWVRAEGSTPAVEADGTPLRAKNVVVLRVVLDYDTGFGDPAGNPVPETVMVGSGEALVASGGRTIPATWTKSGEAAPVVLTGGDGRPVTLAPGNTWIELVPLSTGSVAVG